MTPMQFGPTRRMPLAAGLLEHDRCCSARPSSFGFGEAGAHDDQRGHARRGAVVDDARNRVAGSSHDREVNAMREVPD